ncbi:hypothetical protein GCM10008955_42190 [Deinococcus malanensis]|uniref:Uncharacterized protein n=1 Tax=Deinococcus malanensis TaxID=1706855 RepID=A0ABQ2F691_9DEIO|nr:hypothetical protein GCM10008955_42190 [Deinococcus malanensis]
MYLTNPSRGVAGVLPLTAGVRALPFQGVLEAAHCPDGAPRIYIPQFFAKVRDVHVNNVTTLLEAAKDRFKGLQPNSA